MATENKGENIKSTIVDSVEDEMTDEELESVAGGCRPNQKQKRRAKSVELKHSNNKRA
jgi:hypothetical protein